MKEMKQMPYKVSEGTIERAKYRAKMGVREVANPEVKASHRSYWHWASAVATVATAAVVAVVIFVKPPHKEVPAKPEPVVLTPMETLVAQMRNVSDEILADMSVEAGYYLEEENQL